MLKYLLDMLHALWPRDSDFNMKFLGVEDDAAIGRSDFESSEVRTTYRLGPRYTTARSWVDSSHLFLTMIQGPDSAPDYKV